ncbi:hypothetical protein AMS68_000275 [Peltaster fructicola]|uniref:Ketoreductase (KR) domain-containing protein n=1 Tax=Peltaster fructicola TaxID=286661 RepID=A0A6H0XJE5_9PEZI|nr:hypothetical protein AMS68_000275 [Peltaster fructicola]
MSDQVKYTQKLKGKKVLITGGTSGIGFCVAEASLESGATVIVSSSNPDRVEKAVKRLQQSYPSAASKISGHAADLGTEDTLDASVKALLEKCGKLDHIIHTAGDSLAQLSLESAELSQIKQAGMVRFFAPLMIGKHARQYLNPGLESSLIITTGSTSERPFPGWTIITSYATGLQGMTRALALDLKPIRVNLVSPGAVETELWDPMGEEAKSALLKRIEGTLPTGRVPGPEDLAEAYLYLMRDNNITGSMISSNGGTLLV